MKKNFRFYDNRQKYLLFVTTTNEKAVIAEKLSHIINELKPIKPALKIFDAFAYLQTLQSYLLLMDSI